MEIDYKKLFIKYIYHVEECEGINFIEHGAVYPAPFTEEEWKILNDLSEDAVKFRKEYEGR